ncbi:hypothetical protein BVRB_5g097980 [Beta vulgaris subsp. vulgaris]|nr:hypothetical protein BVRB_5g097980 [Beta vulgaris subsp. vulgaris]
MSYYFSRRKEKIAVLIQSDVCFIKGYVSSFRYVFSE